MISISRLEQIWQSGSWYSIGQMQECEIKSYERSTAYIQLSTRSRVGLRKKSASLGTIVDMMCAYASAASSFSRRILGGLITC